ncbi:aldehyde dehydrogenase family protein [Lentzea sp. DG1S-22]|uniref:aldehyde dehydrogenase family protein n=1 Tax=Lentzea sp. DG1S-22 TaxID=3108822 RepID=UPI002E7A18BA|nr:aldehyde dehydrogenase family protein [Lentzea sp. DG1S-22]WVH82092.1 aldehyde dehydrogenase family protein [Lentzea sp. DG1S-22]
MWTELVDPCTGQTVGHAPESTPDEVSTAASAARRAALSWSAATPGQRQRALLRLADVVEAEADRFVRAEVLTTGKPLVSTREEEVLAAADHLRFFAGAARLHDGIGAAEYLPGHTSYVRREPIGVTGHLLPSNYPLLMAVWQAAPALATGNAVVLKPAQPTPTTASLLAEAAAEFLPAGTLSVVCGGAGTGRALIAHVDAVALTGTTRAGVEVARAAAASVTKVHLELGGNAPAVVFADVDPSAAAESIAEAAFFNAGQDCTAVTRVLVEESIAPELTQALAARAEATVVGPPSHTDAFCGPLITKAHFERVLAVLGRLPAHVRVLAGGKKVHDAGYFLAPTVLAGVQQSDEVVTEELFAPVLTVQTFTGEQEALALANGVPQALTASVWTSDHGRAHRFTAALEAGCVWVNTHMRFTPEMPHGGFKHSGYGKDLSRYAVDEYTRVKHVMHHFIETSGAHVAHG